MFSAPSPYLHLVTWASPPKLAAGTLMDLTDCGFGAEFWSIFWCGILIDCVREFTIQAIIIARHLPDSPISQVEAFLHSIKSYDPRAAIYQKFGPGIPRTDDGILYSAIINQLSGQEAISKQKPFSCKKGQRGESKPTIVDIRAGTLQVCIVLCRILNQVAKGIRRAEMWEINALIWC